jgi:hypothetical protein
MPGFPLAAIGAGLGLFAKQYQEQQAAAERNKMLQMQLAMFQQQMQDRQKQQQLASAEWQSMLGDTGGTGVQPTPGGASAVPPVGGGMPFSAPVPPMSGRDLGGGLRAGGALASGDDIKQRESGGNYNVGYGGADLSNAPLDQYGFPQWPGKMGPAGMSHAAGAYQFQPGTWRPYAEKLGIHDFSPQSQDAVFNAAHAAEGDRPWAASAPRGGQQMAQAGPQTATDAGPGMTDAQAGKQLDQMIPPTVHRKMSLNALVQQVAKISGISDDVRAKLVEDRIKLLAPQEAEYAREYFDTQRAQRTEALADKRQEGMETRAAKREDALTARAEAADKRKWSQPYEITDPETGQKKFVQVNGAGDIRPLEIKGDMSKVGAKRPGTELGAELQFPEKWEGMPDKAPPGVRQDVWAATVEYVRTGKMPSLGFQPGMRNLVITATPAAQHALGLTATSTPDVQAQYAGERHGMIVGGGRAAQIGFGIEEAKKAAPQVVETSKAVPRTQFPAANQFTNWLQQQSGSPETVAFKEALNTYLNIYAASVSRTGRLTDSQQNHAYDLLSTAFNQGQIERGIQQLDYEMSLMREAVGPAMEGITPIGQPPAMRQPETPATPPQAGAPPAQGAPSGIIKYDAQGNRIQ